MNHPPIGLDAQSLQLIANTVPALLAYVDERGHYVWVNNAHRSWFGHPLDSIRGRHVREIVGEVAWATIESHVSRAIAGEEVAFEAHLGFGPGHARDLSVTFVPDRDATGRVRGVVSFATDVSETRSVERALRQSERILIDSQAAAHVGSWDAMVRDDGSLGTLLWSDETYRIFGYEPGAVAIDYALFVSSVMSPRRRDAFRRFAFPVDIFSAIRIAVGHPNVRLTLTERGARQ